MNSQVFDRVESQRKAALVKFIFCLITIPLIELGLLIWAILSNNPDLIIVISLGSGGLILASVFLSISVKNNFVNKAKSELLPVFLEGVLPEGKIADDYKGQIRDEFLRSRFMDFEDGGFYQEKSVIQWKEFRIWDAELARRSGKSSVQIFDGLVGTVSIALPVTGAATYLHDLRKRDLGAAATILISGFLFVITYLLRVELETDIPMIVSGSLIIISLLVLLYQKLHGTQEKKLPTAIVWSLSPDFSDKGNILGKLESQIRDFENAHRNLSVFVTIDKAGVIIGFPEISNFLEINLTNKLSVDSFRKSQAKNLRLIVDELERILSAIK